MSSIYEPCFKNIVHANNVVTVEPGIYIPGWAVSALKISFSSPETGNENLISATRN
ncbi:MAG: hypothetical protein ACLR8P_09450 [Clostridium fessum]